MFSHGLTQRNSDRQMSKTAMLSFSLWTVLYAPPYCQFIKSPTSFTVNFISYCSRLLPGFDINICNLPTIPPKMLTSGFWYWTHTLNICSPDSYLLHYFGVKVVISVEILLTKWMQMNMYHQMITVNGYVYVLM